MGVRFLIAGALVASLLFTTVRGADAAATDEGQALLAKHRAYVGWQMGDGSIPSMTLDGAWTRTKDGKTEPYIARHEVRRGLVRRLTSTYGNGRVYDNGFTGSVFWSADPNGFTVPIIGEPAAERLSAEFVFNEGTTSLAPTVTGHKTIDGVDTVGVHLIHPKPTVPPIDVYVDPSTGAYKRVVIAPGMPEETGYDILAYAEVVPGKRIISSYRLDGSSDTFAYTTMKADTAPTDSQLQPPAPRAHWAFASEAPFPITVTETRIIVTARVNGVEGKFILDTGDASGISLTRDFADRVKLKKVEAASFSGIGGVARGEYDIADSIEIGGNTLSNVYVDSGIRKVDNTAPDGLLGYGLLAGAVVDVDLDAQRMTILDPNVHAPQVAAGIPVLVDLSDQLPIVPMKLNGTVDVRAMLDSGNPIDMLFSSDLIFKQHLRFLVDNSPSAFLNSHRLIGGVGGGYEAVSCGHLDALQLGNVTYRPVPACESRFSGNSNRVLVGLDFLRGFNLTFDYPHALILFSPRKAT